MTDGIKQNIFITAEFAKLKYGVGFKELCRARDNGLIAGRQGEPDRNGDVLYTFLETDVISYLDRKASHAR